MESSGGSKAKSTRMSEVTVVLYSLFSDYDDHDAVSLPSNIACTSVDLQRCSSFKLQDR